MTHFQGYVSHFVLRDEDEKGHLFVVSEWTSRNAADRTLAEYTGAEPVQLITPLLVKPQKAGFLKRIWERLKSDYQSAGYSAV